MLSLVLLIGIAYKPAYEEREGADISLTWQLCFREVASTVPGLVLANTVQVYPEDRGTNYAVRLGDEAATLVARAHAAMESII